MSHILQRTASWTFFAFGTLTLIGLVVLRRGILVDPLTIILHSMDLPLIGSGMAYAGSSLYVSLMERGRGSLTLALVITVPLVLLFALFVFANFGLGFAE